MINTNGLSPLMQAAVGGETQEEGVLIGQEIAMMSQDETGNWVLDEENGELRTTDQGGTLPEGTLINDPDDILEGRTAGDDDVNYRYKVEEDGSYTLISKGPSEGTESPSEENVPTRPMGPGGMGITGGVGGPMPMASPYKNYKNPQDYKVFNWGNKPTPFEKRKKY